MARGNFGVVRDISLQKQVESMLDRKDGSIGKIDAFADPGCFLYDEIHEKFLYVDNALSNLYGVDKEYLLDNVRSRSDDFEFVHKDDRELLDQFYEDFEMGDIWEAEYRMRRADGEIIWVREMGKRFLVLNGVEMQTIGVILDISDRKDSESSLTKSSDSSA